MFCSCPFRLQAFPKGQFLLPRASKVARGSMDDSPAGQQHTLAPRNKRFGILGPRWRWKIQLLPGVQRISPWECAVDFVSEDAGFDITFERKGVMEEPKKNG